MCPMNIDMMDSSDLDLNKVEEKSEEEFIEDMKANIRATTLKVAQKVNKSALNFMVKQKQWISEKNSAEADKFFNEKIPQVLTEELTKSLNSVLGL